MEEIASEVEGLEAQPASVKYHYSLVRQVRRAIH